MTGECRPRDFCTPRRPFGDNHRFAALMTYPLLLPRCRDQGSSLLVELVSCLLTCVRQKRIEIASLIFEVEAISIIKRER